MQSANIAYVAKLDHLRFLAAFMVLMFHSNILYNSPDNVHIPALDHGYIGLGVVIDPKRIAGFAEDKLNHLLLVKVKPGEPLVYHSGACWSKGLDFHSFDEWKSYLEKEAGANP